MTFRLRKARSERDLSGVSDAAIVAEATRRELAVSPTVVGALLLELARRLEHDRALLDELRATRARQAALERELTDLRGHAFQWFEAGVLARAEVSRLAAITAIGSMGVFDLGEASAWCRAAYGRVGDVLTLTANSQESES